MLRRTGAGTVSGVKSFSGHFAERRENFLLEYPAVQVTGAPLKRPVSESRSSERTERLSLPGRLRLGAICCRASILRRSSVSQAPASMSFSKVGRRLCSARSEPV